MSVVARPTILGIGAAACVGVAAATAGPAATVLVVLDLDATTPGLQSNVSVPAGTTVIPDVAVYIFDPSGKAEVFGVGYSGGIDRGIALGHVPGNGNQGAVVSIEAQLGTPLNTANFSVIVESPGLDPSFAGPEVQYVENGAASVAPIPSAPVTPILTADIVLTNATAGDVFDFYLLDYVVVWSEGAGGAFSTQGFLTLDTGGDAVPDGTQTIHGVDPDTPIPVPPAAFLVDYVDGPPGGGPATVTVLQLGDIDGDGEVGVLDFLTLLGDWGPCPDPPEPCAADLDGDGVVAVIDLLLLLANWGPCC